LSVNFVHYVFRGLHLLGVAAWLGGLLFQNVILVPSLGRYTQDAKVLAKRMHRRFASLAWICIWTILGSGIGLMVMDPRYTPFRFTDRWSMLLGYKQLIFLIMAFYAFGYRRMVNYLEEPSSNGGFNERAEMYRHRIRQFQLSSLLLGALALLLAAAM
jgi:putative copper export protein